MDSGEELFQILQDLKALTNNDWCPECKVKIMEGHCFCEWDQPTVKAPTPLEIDGNGNPVDVWFPNGDPIFKAKLIADQQAQEDFKSKLKSISFNRVKGGGRG